MATNRQDYHNGGMVLHGCIGFVACAEAFLLGVVATFHLIMANRHRKALATGRQ